MNNFCPHCGKKLLKNQKHDLGEIEFKYIGYDDLGCIFEDDDFIYRLPNIQNFNENTSNFQSFSDIKGLFTTELKTVGENKLFLQKKHNNYIPLSAWKLNYNKLNPELLWSWFRNLSQICAQIHIKNLYHGGISEESIFIEKTTNRLFIKDFGINNIHNVEKGQNFDLVKLSEIFIQLVEKKTNSRSVNQFISLLVDMRNSEFQNCIELWEFLSPYQRLNQFDPQIINAGVSKSNQFVKIFLLVVPVLFLISVLIAYFLGQDHPSMQINFQIPEKKELITPKKPDLLIIEQYDGKWDKYFPLNRVNNVGDLYIYLNIPEFAKFNFIDFEKFKSMAGISINLPCVKKQNKCFGVFKFDSKTWNGKPLIIIEENYNPNFNNSWRLTYNRVDPYILKSEKPPILSGISGKLLKKSRFNPNNTNSVMILLYWKLSDIPPRQNSLWSLIFGGILPTDMVMRGYKEQNKLILNYSMIYKNQTDSLYIYKHILKVIPSLFDNLHYSIKIQDSYILIDMVFPLK
jgi:hypothetical protein